MNLIHLLSDKRSTVLSMWFNAMVDTYPQDASNFIRTNDNRFANPVGHRISESFALILDGLLSESGPESVTSALDDIIRVRAVQDFSASQAVSFIFSLKRVIRELVSKDKTVAIQSDELLRLEDRIDVYALSAFDIFMKCREKLYDIKANEVRNMTFRILQKAQKMGLDDSDAAAPSDDVVNKKQEEVKK